MGKLISARQLNRVRAANTQFMPDTATVLTPTEGPDGYGGQTVSYSEGDSYQCRFRPASDADRRKIRGGQEMTDPLFVATLPHDAVLGESSRLRIGTTDYDIVGWLGSRSFKAGTILALKEVQPETLQENS
ncbi:MAG: hypothetical protein JNK38_01190 [Acidobacteria bacterium]|nr:hypothetical protein [Acidobacteriota bacterium]